MNGKGASRLMIVTFFQVNVWFEEVFGFSPLGDCAAYPVRSRVVGGSEEDQQEMACVICVIIPEIRNFRFSGE